MNKDLMASSLRLLAPLLAAVMIAAGSYHKGFQTAKQRGDAVLADVVQKQQAADLAAEREYSAKLEAAAAESRKWQDFAQTQSSKLAAANREIDAAEGRLKWEIDDVVQHAQSGAAACSGLDADGLRLYRRALGYDGG